jgi:IrrE N-terminal-like domain
VNLKELAAAATRAAARLRADLGVGATDAICPFDLAEQLGVVTWWVALPSLEGMYSADPGPTILVSTARPPGRRRYTCGHELGHHVFEHGIRLDELESKDPTAWSPEEFLAHRFAAALLMPKLAVESAFARRGSPITTPSPSETFVVAQDLGVGYRTLIGHLERTIRCLKAETASSLRHASPKVLRSQIAGFDAPNDVAVLDRNWGIRPVDLEVGDIALLPPDANITGICAVLLTQPVSHLVAIAPGIGALRLPGRPQRIQVRVSSRGFTGLARFRHLEEVADDQ